MSEEMADSMSRKSLVEGEERFRAIVDILPFPILIHDSEGQIDLVNREWTRLTGYSLDDLRSLTEWEFKAFGAPELSLSGEGERQLRTRDGSFLARKNHAARTRKNSAPSPRNPHSAS